MLHILFYTIFLGLYAIFIKIREAYYYDLQYRLAHNHKDLHEDYTRERIVLFGLHWIYLIDKINWISLLLLIPFTYLVWDFIADGVYFIHRNKLNKHVYPDKFKATESDTTTAITDKKNITKTYKNRLKLFIFANIFLAAAIIIEIIK